MDQDDLGDVRLDSLQHIVFIIDAHSGGDVTMGHLSADVLLAEKWLVTTNHTLGEHAVLDEGTSDGVFLCLGLALRHKVDITVGSDVFQHGEGFRDNLEVVVKQDLHSDIRWSGTSRDG